MFWLVLVSVLLCSRLPAEGALPYIKPWTKPTVRGSRIACWGRTYAFAPSLLPSNIITQGHDVLAEPIELAASIGGRAVTWSEAAFKALGKDAESVRYATTASCGAFVANCAFSTEFDGVTRVDLTLTPRRPVKVDSLEIIVPLRPEYAKLFHHSSVYPVHVWDWPKKRMNAGAVPKEGMKLPFVFHLWLGDDERGVQFFSESDQVLSPGDPESVISVTPSGSKTLLRISLLRDFKLDREWKWTFGFVATPVKPYPREYRKMRYCHMGGYGIERGKDGATPYLDALKSLGVNYLGFHENWSEEQSLPRPGKHEADLKSLVAACRERGIRLVPYTGCYMSTRSPEYQKDWDSLPIGDHYQYQRPDSGDICRIMCNNTGYPDLLLKLYVPALRSLGLGGVYMDGLTYPLPCINTKHGCGYTGPDGQVRPTMAIWRTREFMKSYYRLVRASDPKGIIVAHTSGCVLLPVLSFADFYLDGEHLLSQRKIGTPDYPEDILRAEMCGHNFGIPATQLPVGADETERQRARTICALYDILWMWHPDHQADIWRAFDSFDVTDAQWAPHWKTGKIAISTGADCRISAYLVKGRGALLVIANLGGSSADFNVRVLRSGLGLGKSQALRARDAANAADIPIVGDSFAVDLDAGRFKLISIQGETRKLSRHSLRLTTGGAVADNPNW